MCGLVGVIGTDISANHLTMFKWLLHLDVIRGDHSTGIAYRSKINNSNTLTLIKATGTPDKLHSAYPDMFDEKRNLNLNSLDKVSFLMGHNRAATQGAKNSTNAHPFKHGGIVGCHNGTINRNLNKLPSSPSIQGDTDSEKIFYAMSQGWSVKKIMDTLEENKYASSQANAAALIWWDSKTKTFNIYRNKERPLWCATNKSNTILAYASERWMLEAAIKKARLSASLSEIVEYPVDVHSSFSIGEKEIILEEENKIEPPAVVQQTHYTYYRNNKKNLPDPEDDIPEWIRNSKTKGKEEKTTEESFRSDTGWIDRSDMSEEEFEKDAKFGCAMCTGSLEWEDQQHGDVKWMEKDTPLCIYCASDFSVMEDY